MGGTISNIRHALEMRPNQQRLIRRTLEEIVRCMVEGVIFDGKIENKYKIGFKTITLPGSLEELLTVNWIEAHSEIPMTTVMVNKHRIQQGDERVSCYAIMAAMYYLQP